MSEFDRLSARNILYKQSELLELEAQLEEFDKKDVSENAETRNAARNWRKFWYSSDQRGQERRALMSKIRETIKDYREFLYAEQYRLEFDCVPSDEMLLLESDMHKLERPSQRTVSTLREWFHANNVPVLSGLDKTLLNDEFTEDLVALAPVDTDRLNMFLQNNLGYLLRARKKIYPISRRVNKMSPRQRIKISRTKTCSISRRGVAKWKLRVGMIVLFTVLFAGIVGLLTNARRAELFGCTAAYAAVLVVFVSGNISGN
ncbi:uncharacterized protein PAC_15368 [Phialocephala subalpina]|uniref:DUF6594 domain-containing protein n=1 Tax=Phialocephala subalpina TaxID=576137 RepID=A0A1L7XKC5_9HELO|nr:uncharacterized protein PAC_15368 [Phialocephala subalpina]